MALDSGDVRRYYARRYRTPEGRRRHHLGTAQAVMLEKALAVLQSETVGGGMTRVNASEIRVGLRRAERGRRIVVRRRGRDVAAIVPLADIERLEEMEDRDAARAALAESAPDIPYERLREEAALG
jgi:antitoxin (DNA-binding transcriptional repressor) of toxin-antitoxin stability system